MNKTLIPLLVLGVLVVGGGFLLLGGFFEGENHDSPTTVQKTTSSAPDQPAAPDTRVSEKPPVRPIETSRFTDENEGGSRARLEGEDTGISVTGRVISPEGHPLAKAHVVLVRDVSPIKTRAQEGDVLAELDTQDDGAFRFDNILPGDIYVLKAGHHDYTTERRHPIDPAAPATLRQEIRLKDGLSVMGTVADVGGAPIEGAEVAVYDMNVTNLDPRAEAEQAAMTRPDGTFEVGHLTVGLKRVMVRKEGYSSDGRNGYNLRDQDEKQALNFILSRGYTITGTVRDRRSGAPVEGADVMARPVSLLAPQRAGGPENPSLVDAGDREAAGARLNRSSPQVHAPAGRRSIGGKSFLTCSAVTDDNGRFVVEGLMEARYMVSVSARGYQNDNGRPADAGSEGLVFDLVPSPRILGQVVDDDTGEPVTSFRIALSSTPTPGFVPVQGQQRFDDAADGRFTYVDARPGKHYVIATADGYAGGASEPVVVAAEQEVTGIQVRLVRGATVKGHVSDPDGSPLPNARVTVAAPPNNDPAGIFIDVLQRNMRNSAKRQGITNERGDYTIDGVLAGEYVVKVEHGDYEDGQAGPITCENRGEVSAPPVTLNRGAVIRGIVLKKDGSPDGKATVMITCDMQPTSPVSRETGPDGRFEVRGLKPGTYRVVVAQRDGEFDLLKILQSRNDTSSLVSVRDGEVVEIER